MAKTFIRNGKRCKMPEKWTVTEKTRLVSLAPKLTLAKVVQRWGGKRTSRAIYQQASKLGVTFRASA